TLGHADILARCHGTARIPCIKQRRPGENSDLLFKSVGTSSAALQQPQTYCCGKRRRDEVVVVGCKVISWSRRKVNFDSAGRSMPLPFVRVCAPAPAAPPVMAPMAAPLPP